MGGSPREDPDHKPLELGVVEVGGQCHARTACEQHELNFTALRKDWRRRDRGLACDRSRFSDRPQVLGCFCWLRWLMLQKDILNLVYICESEGLHEVAKYWQMVVDMNEHQKSAFTSKIIASLFNTVTNKKIAVLGFAFKKDTGDVRETPALAVTNMLLQDGACVYVYDPKLKKEDAMTEFKYHNMEVDEKRLVFCSSPAEAVEGAHALVVLTEWDEFKTYPYAEFHAKMMKPACVFDGRGILNHKALEDIGFEVHAIGKGRGVDGRLNVLAQ